MSNQDIRYYTVVGLINLGDGYYQVNCKPNHIFEIKDPKSIPQPEERIMVRFDADTQFPMQMDIVSLVSNQIK